MDEYVIFTPALLHNWATISRIKTHVLFWTCPIQSKRKLIKSIVFAITYVKTKNKVVEPTRRQAAAETGINAPGFILSSRPVPSVDHSDRHIRLDVHKPLFSFVSRETKAARMHNPNKNTYNGKETAHSLTYFSVLSSQKQSRIDPLARVARLGQRV